MRQCIQWNDDVVNCASLQQASPCSRGRILWKRRAIARSTLDEHSSFEGHAVHWIDGGHRFDPSKFFPAMRSLNCPIEDGLRRLYIGRGFTLHQLHALIQRVRHEVALTQASMIVVDGMLAMFLDEQIKRFEARSILRHCMTSLEEVGRNCPIVLLDGKTMSPLHQQLKHTMRPYVRHRLQGTWGDREKTTLRLTSSTGVYQVTLKQPSHPIAQQQLNQFTSIVPAEQLAAQAVALPTNQTEREPTILPAQQVDDSINIDAPKRTIQVFTFPCENNTSQRIDGIFHAHNKTYFRSQFQRITQGL